MTETLPIKKLLMQGAGVRYTGAPESVEKVAILPFRRLASGEVTFLFAAPLPKYDKERELPFGIARGTIQIRIERNGREEVVDLGREDIGGHKVIGREKLHATALREGEEELGIHAKSLAMLYDCGPLAFKEKGIHTYLAEMKEPYPDLGKAADSRDVRWLTRDEAEKLAAKGEFNGSYLPIVKALDVTVRNRFASVGSAGRG